MRKPSPWPGGQRAVPLSTSRRAGPALGQRGTTSLTVAQAPCRQTVFSEGVQVVPGGTPRRIQPSTGVPGGRGDRVVPVPFRCVPVPPCPTLRYHPDPPEPLRVPPVPPVPPQSRGLP